MEAPTDAYPENLRYYQAWLQHRYIYLGPVLIQLAYIQCVQPLDNEKQGDVDGMKFSRNFFGAKLKMGMLTVLYKRTMNNFSTIINFS